MKRSPLTWAWRGFPETNIKDPFFNGFCMGAPGGRSNHWAAEGEYRRGRPCGCPAFHPHSSGQVHILMSSNPNWFALFPVFMTFFTYSRNCFITHQGGKGGVRWENCDLPPGADAAKFILISLAVKTEKSLQSRFEANNLQGQQGLVDRVWKNTWGKIYT